MSTITIAQPCAPADPHAYADRDVRQREIVPPQRLAASCALVIGVGAIGRQVAVQLAALGVPRLDLVDHDVVSVENLAPQAYWPADLGRDKVEATADLCRRIHPQAGLGVHAGRFRRSSVRSLDCLRRGDRPLAAFACVDSMEARRLLWDSLHERVAFWADGRMSAEVVRVLASGDPAGDEHYPTTLFRPEQAYPGACTARSTVYAASVAAGLMLCQFTRWLRGLPVERDVLLNLLSSELVVS